MQIVELKLNVRTFERDVRTTLNVGGAAIRVVDRAQVEDLLIKQKLLVSGRVSDAEAMRAGKLLGAAYIVSGGVVMDKTDARLDIRLVDVETGLTVRSFKEKGKQDDLLTLAKAERRLDSMERNPSAQRKR